MCFENMISGAVKNKKLWACYVYRVSPKEKSCRPSLSPPEFGCFALSIRPTLFNHSPTQKNLFGQQDEDMVQFSPHRFPNLSPLPNQRFLGNLDGHCELHVRVCVCVRACRRMRVRSCTCQKCQRHIYTCQCDK